MGATPLTSDLHFAWGMVARAGVVHGRREGRPSGLILGSIRVPKDCLLEPRVHFLPPGPFSSTVSFHLPTL